MTPQEPVGPLHIDPNNPQYPLSAANILARHNNNEPEANITSAVRSFLTLTGLAVEEGIKEENPPSDTSRRAVDLTAHDTFVEMKRRIGTTGGNNPNPLYIEQLDDYLLQSQSLGKGVRMGILTDGKHWLLRWPNAGPVRTVYLDAICDHPRTSSQAFRIDLKSYILFENLTDEYQVLQGSMWPWLA